MGPVAQWIRHRPTEPGIAGLSPAGVIEKCMPQRTQLVGTATSGFLLYEVATMRAERFELPTF